MISHLVLFRPRADLTTADVEALVRSLEAAARGIPAVRSFRVGRRLAGGPRYPAGAPGEFPFAALVEFDDRAGLESYLAHPEHIALGRAFAAGLAAAMVFDYEMRDVDAGTGGFLLEDRGTMP